MKFSSLEECDNVLVTITQQDQQVDRYNHFKLRPTESLYNKDLISNRG